MKDNHNYYVYILANIHRNVLYVGMTNDLTRRLQEHAEGKVEGFTKRYNIKDLMYYEHYTHVHEAIAREKQIKVWGRKKKNDLIETVNPEWKDISDMSS